MFWNVLWTTLALVKTFLLWIPSMNRSFIILSSGRSGSSMLTMLMNCHPSIFCHTLELLNPDELIQYNLVRDGSTVVSSHHLIKYIKARLVPWKPWLPYTGFKLFNEQIEFCKLPLGNLLNALHSPPVIVLYRENLLETYVSLQISFQTGIWFSEQKINQLSIEIDWEDFQHYAIIERNRWRESMHVLSTHRKILFISYAELSNRKTESMGKIFTFLNLDPSVETSVTSLKQNPLSLREKISNYQEIMNRLELSDLSPELTSNWLQKCMRSSQT